jgi:small subunit ribosomal protein S20
MPNTKQAKKRVRQDEIQRLRNKTIKSRMRTAVKHVLQADDSAKAAEALPEAMRRIDKAAKTNVIHDNAAARYKNRVSCAANSK